MAYLTKLTEYTWIDDGKARVVNVSMQWLRDNVKPGGKYGLFANPITRSLEIRALNESGDPVGNSRRAAN